MWDHQGPTEKQTARIVFIFDTNTNESMFGVGVINSLPSGETRLKSYEIRKNLLVELDELRIDKDGNVVGKNVGVITASEDCLTCHQVCGSLYGGACSLTGVLTCTLVCAPIGTLACPVICGVLFTIICVIGTNTNCDLICDDLGYC